MQLEQSWGSLIADLENARKLELARHPDAEAAATSDDVGGAATGAGAGAGGGGGGAGSGGGGARADGSADTSWVGAHGEGMYGAETVEHTTPASLMGMSAGGVDATGAPRAEHFM